MKVKWSCTKSNRFDIYFYPEKSDTEKSKLDASNKRPHLNRKKCSFWMPNGWSSDQLHPDLLALAVALIVEPFTAERIVLPIGVSKSFASSFHKYKRIKLLPVDEKLTLREAKDDAVTGLCFSGGIDSTAAAAILPKKSPLVFAKRVVPKDEARGLYDDSAAVHACKELKKLGHAAWELNTDFEFVRSPKGFPTNYSSAVPLILLADYLNIDSIGYGMVLESAYAVGDAKFSNRSSELFHLINHSGLPINLLVSGMSEVATSKIVHSKPEYNAVAQSCVRGKPNAPCGYCMKCFRKQLLEQAITGGDFSIVDLSDKLKHAEIYKTLIKQPLHHEGVYTYIYNKYQKGGVGHWLLRHKVNSHRLDYLWLEKWYPKSSEKIPARNRNELVTSIMRHLDPMSSDEIITLESFDPKNNQIGLSGLFYMFWGRLFNLYAGFFYYLNKLKNQ